MVRRLPLHTPGHFALVDNADFADLQRFRWYLRKGKNTNYAFRWDRELKRAVALHQHLMPLPPGKCVDHINRNGLDCQRSNMRESTPSLNRANARKRHNATGYQGVQQHGSSTWTGHIECQGILYSASRFPTPEDAARWYDEMAIRLFGEFAVLNFPIEADRAA